MLQTVLLGLAMAAGDTPLEIIELEVPPVPPAIERAMRVRDPLWQFPRRMQARFRGSCLPPGSPDFPYLVTGDFDGDALDDHAFWAVSGIAGAKTMTLFLLESRTGRLHELDRATGEAHHLEPLILEPRGSSVYDYHTGRTTVLRHDAPGALVCWKTSRAWVRERDGTYREWLTSD